MSSCSTTPMASPRSSQTNHPGTTLFLKGNSASAPLQNIEPLGPSLFPWQGWQRSDCFVQRLAAA